MSASAPIPSVAVTGASGLIGSALVDRLRGEGFRILSLVRRPPRAPDEVRWDPGGGGFDASPLEPVDAVVHLAGEPVAQRWTTDNKARIARSRIGGTRALVDALTGLQRRPPVLVTASAVGVYGADRGDEALTEESPPGSDFMAQLGKGWEGATEPAAEAGIRVVNLRFGVVLSRHGGALARMLPAFRLGVGGRVGSGRQWMSWIALDDVVELVLRAIRDPAMTGAYNAVAGAVPSGEFTRTLGRVLHRPTLLPAPLFALRLVYGQEMLDATLLASQRVEALRLREMGHRFAHPELEDALRAALSRR